MSNAQYYTRYRHSPKLITPIQSIPTIKTIEELKPQEGIQRYYPYQGLDDKRRMYNRAKQDEQLKTFLANYNDPTELNSFIDALTNRAAVSKEFGDTWGAISTTSGQAAVTARVAALALEAAAWIASALLPDAGAIGVAGSAGAAAIRAAKVADTARKIAKGFNTASAILAIPAAPAAAKVAYDYGIQPIMHGKPKEAGINMLMNLGETMDYTANPIKGLFLEGPEGFIKATGIGPDGRYNYDYDTGNVLTDMFLEIITDPMNWIDVGTAKGIKTLSTTAGKNLTDDLVLDIVPNINKKLIAGKFPELTEKQVKNIQKRMSNVAAELSREWSDLAVKNLDITAKNALLENGRTRLQRELVNAIRSQAPDLTSEQMMEILQKSGKNAYTKRRTKSALTKIQNVQMDTLARDVIGHLSELQHYSDDFQKFLMKGALLTSGYGLGMEAVRKLYDPIVKWANNFTIPRLVKAGVLDPKTKKINIKDWTKFKSTWVAAHKYTTAITGEVTQRTEGTMFVFAVQQFTEDMQVIRNTIIDNLDPAIREAKLDNYFTKMYGTTYAEYITYLKQINDMESQRFKVFVDYAEQAQTTLTKQAGNVILKGASKTISQVFKTNNITSLIKNQQSLIEKLQGAITHKKNKIVISNDLYTVKLNDAIVTSLLIEDPTVLQVFEAIKADHGLGSLLQKIKSDANAYYSTADARLPILATELIEASEVFFNTRDLYSNICAAVFPKIKGIRDEQFKRYILDEILGFKGETTSTLLNSFDTITMPALASKLEVMMSDVKFKIADYPGVYEQIGSAFKHFLKQCQEHGVENFEQVLPKNFTSNTTEFLKVIQERLPNIAKEFEDLVQANNSINALLFTVKTRNIELMASVLSDNDTIFHVKNTRKLADYGLAEKTIAASKNLELWDVTLGMPNDVIAQFNKYGKIMNNMYEDIMQYNKLLRKHSTTGQITACYDKIYEDFIMKNKDNELIQNFQYMRYALDPTMQFTQLAVLKKVIQDDVDLLNLFKQTLQTELGPDTKLYLWIMNPNPLMTTDFAWDAMAQSKWIVEKQFDNNLINSVNAYRDLSTMSEKLTGDFETIRDYLSTNALDRPQLLQQERYIKAVSKINDTLEFLEKYYDSLFDKQIATEQIEMLFDRALHYPTFKEKYEPLINDIKKYWYGEKLFKQSKKSAETMEAARLRISITYYENYLKNAKDSVSYERFALLLQTAKTNLKKLQDRGFDDEFTPFWKNIKQMNKDLIKIQNAETAPSIFKEYLSTQDWQDIFINQKYKGETLIKIMTDPMYELTDTDYELYVNVLNLMQKKFNRIRSSTGRTYAEVLWEFIPASFKEVEFKYLYEVLGVSDPRLVLELLTEETNKISRLAGWHKQKTGEIVSIITQKNSRKFKEILQTYRHESLHHILTKLTHTAEERYAILFNFENDFIQTFGEVYYDHVMSLLAQQYQKAYQLSSIDFKKLYLEDHAMLLEELLARVFGDQLLTDEFFIQLNSGKLVLPNLSENVTKANMTNFSRHIVEQFEQRVLDAGLKPTADYFTTIQSKNKLVIQPVSKYKIVTPWDPVRKQQELNKAINKATDQNAKGTLYGLMRLSPEQFEQELAFRHRFITFTQDDIADGQLYHMFNHFVKTINNHPHIAHVYDADTKRHWFVLKKSRKVQASGRQYVLDGVPLTRVRLNKHFEEFNSVDNLITDSTNPGIVNTLNNWRDAMKELTGADLGDSQGEFLDQKALEAIHAQMPDEVKSLIDLEDITDKQFFEAYAFNESILGTRTSKQKLGMYSTNLIINMRNATVEAQAYLKPKVEYVNTVFDSQFSIGNVNGIFKGFTDEEILEALQKNSDYKLVALVDDKKYGMRTKEILPTSVEAIKKAKELGAVVIPLQTYKDMYNVVNHRLGSTGFAKWWNRIIYTYKFGYLLRPGAFIRNWVDTNLKSYLEMGEERKSYMALSHRILNDIEKMQDYVDNYARLNLDPTKTTIKVKTTRELQEEYFSQASSFLSYEEFLDLQRDFFSQKVSGNIMAELYATEGGDVWEAFTRATGRIVEMGNQTENYNRLAIYLYELDHGADYTGALAKLSHIHFDYSFKNRAEQLVEMVFPFTTFSLRNYSYWIQMLEKYPWLLRNYTHIMKPSWDFKDYTPEQLATDYRAQNQIISGQLKIAEFKDKLVTFKANPSIQDALQMFSNPINNVYEKLAAPISVPLALATGRYTQPTNIVPVIGPMIQSAQTMVKTGTPMPSAIAVQPSRKATQVKFKNKNTNKINQFRDKQYRVPKYRNNVVFDSYKTIGVQRYRVNMYPVIDIAHEIKSRYTTNVYAKIKSRVTTDVYKGIRYRIKLDANRFR